MDWHTRLGNDLRREGRWVPGVGRLGSTFLWIVLASACGGSQPSEGRVQRGNTHRAAPAVEAQPSALEPGPSEVSETGSAPASNAAPLPEGSLEELLAFGLEPRDDTQPMPSPRQAVDGCPPFEGRGAPGYEWFERCQLRETLARTQTGWLAFQVDWDEGGPESLHLVEGDSSGSTERVGGDVTPHRVEAVRRALVSDRVHPVRDRVGQAVHVTFSLGGYDPLVELEGTESLLWLETTQDLDDPEWVLWLVSRDGESRRELGRRTARLGACDGGGYWCEATQAECDDEGLRDEGRLCVLPLGIARVATNGRELAMLGSIMVAGHGGMPGLTWFVELPESAPSE